MDEAVTSGENHIRKIRKRDGRIVPFDPERVINVILKAAHAVGGHDERLAEQLAAKAIAELNRKFKPGETPAVEEIQDVVEKTLIENGHARTAKAFILYRQKRAELRESKRSILGFYDDSKLTMAGAKVVKEKYLLRDEKGEIIETPIQMLKRVAHALAAVEKRYTNGIDCRQLSDQLYDIMHSLEFLPSGRILANAGSKSRMLASDFALPVEDSMDDIFQTIKEQALIHKVGGGTGFDFSRLRPRGDPAAGVPANASGPVRFIGIFDSVASVIRVGTRRGANMGILRVDHPDILEFITAKEREGALSNFNISVALTDRFMRAVAENRNYSLINPRTKETVRELNARKVFDLLVVSAWKKAEPGILFIDKMNAQNPTRHAGNICATGPCADTLLHEYESCIMGSLNLARFVRGDKINWIRLKEVTKLAVRILDNAIDICSYPLKRSEQISRNMRRIGLGVMGWADMLYQLKIPYDSERGIELAKKIMKFINDQAIQASQELAEEKGTFPSWEGSEFQKRGMRRRNVSVTAIAPTGSISILADTSGGIEPHFALSYIKRVLDGSEFVYVNRYFEDIARQKGFYSEPLMRKIAENGTLQGIGDVPNEVKKIFVVAHDISPEWHVKMQAAFQKHVENAISKTINFPNTATINDVERAYMLAYKLSCKGISIYRDRSRENQIFSIGVAENE
jgi:ribonucleoside-diphosphate reductase alpha chain